MARYALLPCSSWPKPGTTALAEAANPRARTATPVTRVLLMPGSAESMAHSRYNKTGDSHQAGGDDVSSREVHLLPPFPFARRCRACP